MTAMSSFSHHHHHHHHPPPPPPPNGPLSVSPNLSGLPPSNTTTASIVSNNSSQQCLQQSVSQQQHLQRDIISPSPYQCHMSVRHSPCSPSQGVSSVYQMNGSSPAAYGTSNTPNGGTTGKQKLIDMKYELQGSKQTSLKGHLRKNLAMSRRPNSKKLFWVQKVLAHISHVAAHFQDIRTQAALTSKADPNISNKSCSFVPSRTALGDGRFYVVFGRWLSQ